ncbi:MAG: CHAT domain-containing protein [Planctomycetes bacterium]|nr:CHAT domain-containing protein [Planctomycetota bacterium]
MSRASLRSSAVSGLEAVLALLRAGEAHLAAGEGARARAAFDLALLALRDPSATPTPETELRRRYARWRRGSAALLGGWDLSAARRDLEAVAGRPRGAPPSERRRVDPSALLKAELPAELVADLGHLIDLAAKVELGHLESREARRGRAIDLLEESAEELQGVCPLWAGHAYRYAAITHAINHSPGQAWISHARAIAQYGQLEEVSEGRWWQALTRASAAKRAADAGEHERALTLLDEGVAALRERSLPCYFLLWARCLNLRKIAGREEESFVALCESYEELERAARSLGAGRYSIARQRWLQGTNKTRIAEHYLDELIARSEVDRAVATLSRLTGWALMDAVAAGPLGATPPGLEEAYDEARARLRDLDQGGTQDASEEARARRVELMSEVEQLELTLAASGAPGRLAAAPTASPAALAAALPPNALLVEFYQARRGPLRATLLRRDKGEGIAALRIVEIPSPLSPSEFADRLAERTECSRTALMTQGPEAAARAFNEGAGRALYELLYEGYVAPLEELLAGASELVVAGDAPPLHLAIDPEGEFLLDRLPVSYLPTSSLLALRGAAALPGLRRSSPALCLLVDSSEASVAEVGPLLTHAEDLVLIKGTRVSLRERLATRLEQMELVHVAGHAGGQEHAERFPSQAYLSLGDEEGRSGERLTVGDLLLRTPFNERALVCLSGCSTAGALSEAALTSGASVVVGTAWEIDGAFARRLFDRFYRLAFGGNEDPVHHLLRQAILDLRASGDPLSALPLVWGPWTCTYPLGSRRSDPCAEE